MPVPECREAPDLSVAPPPAGPGLAVSALVAYRHAELGNGARRPRQQQQPRSGGSPVRVRSPHPNRRVGCSTRGGPDHLRGGCAAAGFEATGRGDSCPPPPRALLAGLVEGGALPLRLARKWSAGHPGPSMARHSAIRMAESFGFSPLRMRKTGSVGHFACPSGRMSGPSDVRLPDGPIAGLLSCPEAET